MSRSSGSAAASSMLRGFVGEVHDASAGGLVVRRPRQEQLRLVDGAEPRWRGVIGLRFVEVVLRWKLRRGHRHHTGHLDLRLSGCSQHRDAAHAPADQEHLFHTPALQEVDGRDDVLPVVPELHVFTGAAVAAAEPAEVERQHRVPLIGQNRLERFPVILPGERAESVRQDDPHGAVAPDPADQRRPIVGLEPNGFEARGFGRLRRLGCGRLPRRRLASRTRPPAGRPGRASRLRGTRVRAYPEAESASASSAP